MAEQTTIARPYAQAIFDLAREGGDFEAWSAKLALMSAVAADPQMLALVRSPRARREEMAELFNQVCDGTSGAAAMDEAGRNLVRMLAHNRRLDAIPAVATQFERLRAQAEHTLDAELSSALPVSEEQLAALVAALEGRLGSRVNLTCSTDPELIGGAVIRAGDWVVDGSVRAQLARLAGALGASAPA